MTIHMGQWRVVPLVEAVGPGLPTRATFPTVEPGLLPAQPHLTMASQGFAILGAGRVILVDTCLGGPKPLRPNPRPGLDSRWLDVLARAGIEPGDVDTVVNTHLHHDHVGWNTVLDDTGLRPTFPNARYLVSAAELAHSTVDSPQTHVVDSVLPVRDAGLLRPCPPDHPIAEEVRLVPAPGHTPGHTMVEVGGAGRRVLLTGDLVHHPLQLRHPDVSTALCADPARAAATRRAVLDRYADTGTLLLPSHFPEGGYLRRAGDGYRLDPP